MVLALGIRPADGFRELIPQQNAGLRTDPPMSLPKPNGLIPLAIAEASPPLDPPAVLVLSQGLRVRPLNGLSVSILNPSSVSYTHLTLPTILRV